MDTKRNAAKLAQVAALLAATPRTAAEMQAVVEDVAKATSFSQAQIATVINDATANRPVA